VHDSGVVPAAITKKKSTPQRENSQLFAHLLSLQKTKMMIHAMLGFFL